MPIELMIAPTQKASSWLNKERRCFDSRSGSVTQAWIQQDFKLITVAGTLIKLHAIVPSTKKINSLKQKDGEGPKHTGLKRVKLRESRQLILLEDPLK